MNKQEITEKVNTLLEMLFTEGKIQGMERSSQIFTGEPATESESIGSDPHPTITPIKPVDIKSITIELEDNQIVLKLGSEVRNKHITPIAETKFTQLLAMIKDQFSNWNSQNGKNN